MQNTLLKTLKLIVQSKFNISYCKVRQKYFNCMKNKCISNKVRNTILKRINSGEIMYLSGKNHYLYKGNREFKKYCRDILYNSWTKDVLKRDNFKCVVCGSNKDLQVHHIRPLRDIIKLVFEKHGLNSNKPLFEYENEFFKQLAEEVVSEHKLKDGVTLCKFCHEKYDYYYRLIKGKHKEKINEDFKDYI